MSILVVGSVAFDDIASPSGSVKNILGGAATYFSLAASYFTKVRVVAVVGEDFGAGEENVFHQHGIDIQGIERAKGKTFRWGGSYADNLNEAKTDYTDLNVFEIFHPQIPKQYDDTEFLFLANIQPTLQANVRRNMSGVRLTGCDTMNYWIKGSPKELAETLKLVNVLLINDTEAKMLAGETNLPRAANKVLAMGPQALVIKHGEYGATIFFREGAFGIGRHPFRAPALPIEEVKDPTGANLVNEISAWHNMPQIIRRTKSFCDVAGLDSAAMTKILMLEPMSFDINEFCSKIESNVGRRVTTADAKDILQRFGFRADHAEWVLEGPPSRDFLESIDTATIK